MSDDLRVDFITKIKNIHEEICNYPELKEAKIKNELKGLNITETDPTVITDYIDSLWLAARQDINLLNDESKINRIGDLIRLLEGMVCGIPRFTLLGNKLPYTKTDSERKEIVLNILKECDNNLPNDITIFEEEMSLKEAIEKQKQENIDKADIEYVGKTQAQINAENNNNLILEIKDQDGNVVKESPIV